MATVIRYSKLSASAIAAGVILTGIEVYGSVSYLLSQSQPSYLVLGGAIVTAITAILLPLAERMARDRRYLLAALLLAAMVPALSIIVCAAVERTGAPGMRQHGATRHLRPSSR